MFFFVLVFPNVQGVRGARGRVPAQPGGGVCGGARRADAEVRVRAPRPRPRLSRAYYCTARAFPVTWVAAATPAKRGSDGVAAGRVCGSGLGSVARGGLIVPVGAHAARRALPIASGRAMRGRGAGAVRMHGWAPSVDGAVSLIAGVDKASSAISVSMQACMCARVPPACLRDGARRQGKPHVTSRTCP